MRIFHFNAQSTRAITEYGSHNATVLPLFRHSNDVFTVIIRVEAGGALGYHQAVGEQLFMVIEGSGWVRAGDDAKVPISAGQAAFWQSGEWHETTTDTGLTAIVIEGSKLDLVDLKSRGEL